MRNNQKKTPYRQNKRKLAEDKSMPQTQREEKAYIPQTASPESTQGKIPPRALLEAMFRWQMRQKKYR